MAAGIALAKISHGIDEQRQEADREDDGARA